MLVLLLFAFLGGVITVLSPCILPVLPIVLSASTSEGKKRPYGVITGFIVSFTAVTLSLSFVVRQFDLSPDVLRVAAAIIILALGLTLLVPKLQLFFEKAVAGLSRRGSVQTNKSGFWGGFITGLTLGFVWAPCVGPIMAAVITLAITETVSWNALLITVFYSLGTAIPLFAVMQGGRKLLNKVTWLKTNSGKIQRVFAALMLVAAIAIFFNLDRRFQSWILDVFPGYGSALTSIEENNLIEENLDKLSGSKSGK